MGIKVFLLTGAPPVRLRLIGSRPMARLPSRRTRQTASPLAGCDSSSGLPVLAFKGKKTAGEQANAEFKSDLFAP